MPEHEYDARTLIRKGFLYDFLKTVLFKPLLTMKGRQEIKNWFLNQDTVTLPDEKDVFKSGTSFVNYIHLQVTMYNIVDEILSNRVFPLVLDLWAHQTTYITNHLK